MSTLLINSHSAHAAAIRTSYLIGFHYKQAEARASHLFIRPVEIQRNTHCASAGFLTAWRPGANSSRSSDLVLCHKPLQLLPARGLNADGTSPTSCFHLDLNPITPCYSLYKMLSNPQCGSAHLHKSTVSKITCVPACFNKLESP